MKNKRKIILLILMVIFAAVFIYSGATLALELTQRERDDETFDELAELIMLPEATVEDVSVFDTSVPLNNNIDESDIQSENNNEPQIYHKRNLLPIIEKNPDCAGWIYIEDTEINYPVMYTPKDPHKYIDLSFDLKSSSYGVPFIEDKCSPNGEHVVIYGHNMKNGSMFAAIKLYRDRAFFDSHSVIEYETPEGCKTYSVLAICMVKASDDWYSYLEFDDEEEFEQKLSAVLKSAIHKADFEVHFGKQIITLSTCQGSDKNERYILIAVEN